MKRMKRLASFVLAMVMIMTMTMSAFAAKVDNKTGHSYDAYQIFSGTQADGDAALGDVEWGSGIKGDEFLTALKADLRFVKSEVNVFASCTTAMQVADVLAKNTDLADAFANVADANLTTTKIEIAKDATDVTLDPGYYLLVDTEDVSGAYAASNSALLQVTGQEDILMKDKYDLPVPDKDIIRILNADSEGQAYLTGSEVGDAEIGNTITFSLTGTVSKNLADYETYYYAFHDTMSAGLKYVEGSAKVYIAGSPDTEITGFTVDQTVNEKGNLHFVCNNLKAVEGVTASSMIKVVYEATLEKNAVIGSAGNPNTMYIEYSNNPNHDSEGSTGNTEKDTVVIFTYELDVNKIDDATNNKLQGAQFVLLNSDATKVAKVVDGVLDGWVAVPTPDEAGNIAWPAESVLTSGADGKFSIKGLDSGDYFLKEIKAPAGYNLLTENIKLTIQVSLVPPQGPDEEDSAEPSVEYLALVVNAGDPVEKDATVGIVDTTVANNKGGVLPETGGMGTTIFYVIGAVLVIGAGVLLVTRRRMNTEA